MPNPRSLRYREPDLVQPRPTAPAVLPLALRVVNVVVGLASVLVHALPVCLLWAMDDEVRRAVRTGTASRELVLFVLLLAGAASSALLVPASFARRRRWIYAWAGLEFGVTIAMCVFAFATGQGRSAILLMRGFVSAAYAGSVLWVALPPERA